MTIKNLPIGEVVVSALNPRRIDQDDPDEQTALEELRASIHEHGVLEPCIGRLLPDDTGRVELFVGQRRLIASRRDGREKIPVDVRDLSDAQGVKLALTEQIQRKGLKPLQEAESMQLLKTQSGLSDDEIGASIGKPPSYVRRRLALLNLAPKVARALELGTLGVEHALLLADVPSSKAQEELLERTLDVPDEVDSISPSALRNVIFRDYVLALDSAPFDTTDPALVPKAGACTTCPKNTGVQPDLLAGAPGARPLCTDRDCWGGKVNQHLVVISKRDGKRVMPASHAAGVFDQWGHVVPGKGYVDLDASCHQLSPASPAYGKPWRKALGKKALGDLTIVLAKTPTGAVRELVAEGLAKEALGKAHPTQTAAAPEKTRRNGNGASTPASSRRDDPEDVLDEQLEERLGWAVLAEIARSIVDHGEKPHPTESVRIATECAAFSIAGPLPRDLETVFGAASWEELAGATSRVDPSVCRAILICASLARYVEEDGAGGYVQKLAAAYGVKPKAVEKKLRAAIAGKG